MAVTRFYKDKAGTLWKGPLYCGEKIFFAAMNDLHNERDSIDESWIEVDRERAMSLDALNKFLGHTALPSNPTMIERARHVAVKAHTNQTRWNGDAYITHPMRVANSLTTEDERVVGLLHDVVEDTDVTLEQLQEFGFSETQLAAVDSVTERKGESYLEFVLRSRANSIGCRVKEADIKDNLSGLFGDMYQDRIDKYKLALWILNIPVTVKGDINECIQLLMEGESLETYAQKELAMEILRLRRLEGGIV